MIFEWKKPSEAFTDIITEALPVDVVCISISLLCSSTALRVISNDKVGATAGSTHKHTL